MPLRVLEVVLPEQHLKKTEELLREKPVVEVWYNRISEQQTLLKILATAEATEHLMDQLDKHFAGRPWFRLILMPAMNVIFLLMGMMIIVGVLKKTGMFQWLAYKSYALAKGNIFVLAGNLAVATVMVLWVRAIASAFIDNTPFHGDDAAHCSFFKYYHPRRRVRYPVVEPGSGGLSG